MNRRNLLRMLAGAAVAPSGLLVPERKIFLPPVGGWPTENPLFYGLVGRYEGLQIQKNLFTTSWLQAAVREARRKSILPALIGDEECYMLIRAREPLP